MYWFLWHKKQLFAIFVIRLSNWLFWICKLDIWCIDWKKLRVSFQFVRLLHCSRISHGLVHPAVGIQLSDWYCQYYTWRNMGMVEPAILWGKPITRIPLQSSFWYGYPRTLWGFIHIIKIIIDSKHGECPRILWVKYPCQPYTVTKTLVLPRCNNLPKQKRKEWSAHAPVRFDVEMMANRRTKKWELFSLYGV